MPRTTSTHMTRSLLALTVAAVLAAGVSMVGTAAASPPGVQPVAAGDVKLAESSSALIDNQPDLVLDGRMGTAWITDPGTAVGESITLRFATTRYLTRVDILPGFGRDSGSFRLHARPTSVRLSWDGGSETFAVSDRRRYQSLHLAGMARTRTLTVTIEAVSGAVRRGAAISEITPFEPEDVLALDPELRSRIEADVSRLGTPEGGDEALQKVIGYGRPAVPWIADRVARGDADAGSAALAAMLSLDPSESRRLMRRLLSEGTAAQVAVVLRGLRHHGAGTDGIETALYQAATRFKGDIGLAAVEQLAIAGDKRALPLLKKALTSPDASARSLATAHLGNFAEAGREIAARQLNAEAESIRLAALAALGAFDDEETVALVAPLTRHASALTRAAAVRAMGRIHSPHARNELGLIVAMADPATLDIALAALVAHDGEAIPMLRQMIDGDDAELAERTFEHLGRAGGAGVRRMLVKMVLVEATDAASWYRHAERALAAQGRKGVLGVLDYIDVHPRKARLATGFMERVADGAAPVASQRLASLGPDRDLDDLRVLLIQTIEHAGYAGAANIVIRVYKDVITSDRVRRVALTALGALPSQQSKDIALKAMNHADIRISMIGLQTAARLGDERATGPVLGELTRRHVRDWRAPSVEALGALKARAAVQLFQLRFSYASRPIQLAILRACQRIGGRGALSILVDATIHRDPVISRAAQSLLSAQK